MLSRTVLNDAEAVNGRQQGVQVANQAFVDRLCVSTVECSKPNHTYSTSIGQEPHQNHIMLAVVTYRTVPGACPACAGARTLAVSD